MTKQANTHTKTFVPETAQIFRANKSLVDDRWYRSENTKNRFSKTNRRYRMFDRNKYCTPGVVELVLITQKSISKVASAIPHVGFYCTR